MLYSQAVHLENSGEITMAVSLYRKAFRINPNLTHGDVEQLALKLSVHAPEGSQFYGFDTITRETKPMAKSSAVRPLILDGDHTIITRTETPIVEFSDSKPAEQLFIGDLAPEIMHIILTHLDAASIDLFGSVCARWHIMSRDALLWRHKCIELWGEEAEEVVARFDNSWRKLYIHKPHLHFDGLYISKYSSHTQQVFFSFCYFLFIYLFFCRLQNFVRAMWRK
jgi:F-box protein 9